MWGDNHELFIFIVFLTVCKIEQPDCLQQNGMKILKWKCGVEISCFVKSRWKILSLKMRRALNLK